MQSEKRRVFSIGAWSPALRSLLNSRIEPCGCVIGVYEVWSGDTVAVVDVPHPECARGHRVGDVEPALEPARQ